MTAPLLLATALSALLAAPPDDPRKPAPDDFTPDPSWKALDKKGHRPLWFDPKERRLILRARVALREGALEHLLCATDSKEHESVLATDAPPQLIHAGLLLTGAEKGHPVRYRPKFEPPEGSPVNIELEWAEGGKPKRANALEWVKDSHTGKPPERTWVFAGSEHFKDPETDRVHYAADGGDLITVANFASAILDLPLASTPNDAERVFVANTDRIPPRGTYVTMIFRPAPAPKAKP